MTRIVAYFSVGCFLMLLQSACLPRLIPFHFTPDLLLVLIVYLGLNEDYLRGSVLAYLLGCLMDAFAGFYLGLHGMALLATFLLVRSAAGRLNTESSILLLLMVCCGTLVHGTVVAALGFLAEAGQLWLQILTRLFPQLLLNLAAAWVVLKIVVGLQRRLAPRREIPGLKRLDSRYEP
jgi:rod shape-determining protein MreD